jgi:DNA-binding NarL/FixJ family response regulator
MDFSRPDGTGLEAARAILSEQPNAKIVFLTDHAENPRTTECNPRSSEGQPPLLRGPAPAP